MKPPKKSTEMLLSEGFIYGKDITAKSVEHAVITTPHGRSFAFLCYFDFIYPQTLSRYFVSVGDRDPEDRKSHRFLVVESGGVQLSSFLRDNELYRVCDSHSLRLPTRLQREFGVFLNGEIDIALTRAVFGATQSEVQEGIDAYYRATNLLGGTSILQMESDARITCSPRRENHCDITGAYIPAEFPYIALEDGNYLGSHVSLSGFYRQIALLCSFQVARVPEAEDARGFLAALLQCGAKLETIKVLCDAAFASQHPIRDPAERLCADEAQKRRLAIA